MPQLLCRREFAGTPRSLTRMSGGNRAIMLAWATVGFTPILALAISLLGLCTLPVSAGVLIGGGVVVGGVLGFRCPGYLPLVLRGFGAGLAAVLLYDAARWSSIAAGWWGDFIPSIGGWLLGTNQPDWLLGYVYRWLGDGAGMGMTFVVASRMLSPAASSRIVFGHGIAYGVGIWLCLITTLVAAPDGQQQMFPITPTTLALSLAGHLIYGATLGTLSPRADRTAVGRHSRRAPQGAPMAWSG